MKVFLKRGLNGASGAKNTIYKLKTSLNGHKSRLKTMEEKNKTLEDIASEAIQNETPGKGRWK